MYFSEDEASRQLDATSRHGGGFFEGYFLGSLAGMLIRRWRRAHRRR